VRPSPTAPKGTPLRKAGRHLISTCRQDPPVVAGLSGDVTVGGACRARLVKLLRPRLASLFSQRLRCDEKRAPHPTACCPAGPSLPHDGDRPCPNRPRLLPSAPNSQASNFSPTISDENLRDPGPCCAAFSEFRPDVGARGGDGILRKTAPRRSTPRLESRLRFSHSSSRSAGPLAAAAAMIPFIHRRMETTPPRLAGQRSVAWVPVR